MKSDKKEALDEDFFCNDVCDAVSFYVPDQLVVRGFTWFFVN